MDHIQHTVLCVDDEKSILNSLKRLLRREGYRLLTANSGEDGLKLLKENDVHLVISDQRMPELSGTDFMEKVKQEYPDTIRIILTGYTDVDAITESINKGNIYKFFLKPWNDDTLKMEIKKALEQYELVQANKRLQEKILEKNRKLHEINENLEFMVQERTRDLEFQNQALELSRVILENLPMPIIGISVDGLIVMMNHRAESLSKKSSGFSVGEKIDNHFNEKINGIINETFTSNTVKTVKEYGYINELYNIDLIPLGGKFSGKGVVMVWEKI